MVSIMTALNPDGDMDNYTNAANDIIELESNLAMVRILEGLCNYLSNLCTSLTVRSIEGLIHTI